MDKNNKLPNQDILLCNPLEVHRSSPDGQEFDGGPLLKETLQITQLENDKQILEKERNLLKDEVTSLREENQELCNRCARLEEEMHLEMNRKDEVITSNRSKIQDMEQSLDMMKTEFESMEDYWQTKLEEERSFYEEQLRKNEDEFSKLEIQMNEYENMYDCNKKVEDDRLSTIEESCSMEAQISDWEDEIQQLKQQLEREQEQSKQLREQLHSDSQEMKELREELEDLEKKNIYMEEIQQQWSKKLAQVEESCRIKVSKLQEEITCKTSSFENSKPGSSESEKEKAMWRLDLANPGHQPQLAVSLSNAGPQSLNEMGSQKSSTITFIPHSPRQGPSSLPSDLVTSAQREVKRLQELRRIIQEECDALLLKKERLKEEVGQLVTDGMILYSKDQSETTPINAVMDDTFDSMLLTEDITPTKSATKMHDDKIVGVINGDGESKMMLSFDETSFDKLVLSVSSIEQRLLALHKSPRNSSQESADNQDARTSVNFDEAGLSNSHVTRKDAWTQLPSCLAGVGAAKSAVEGAEQHACLEEGEGHSHLDTISALLMAYKVVYMDIEKERKQLELELEDNLEAVRTGCEDLQDGSVSSRGTDRTVQEAGSTSSNGGSDQVYLSVSIHGENGVYTCLKQRIEDQQSRCNQLQHALTRQKSETSRVLSSMKEQHREEVEQLEGLVASAQQLLTNQTQKYSQQMERLSLADRVIMELLSENETLNTALFSLQGQIRDGRSAAVGTRIHQGQGGQGQADNSLAYNQGQGGEYSEDSSLDHDSYHSHNQPHSSENSHFVYQVEEI